MDGQKHGQSQARERQGGQEPGLRAELLQKQVEDRQDDERAFRNQALDRVARAPESMRAAYRRNVNARLREMGLAELAE